MITICTSRTFILCEAINHITLRADPENIGYTGTLIPYYIVSICFVQGSRNNSNQNNTSREDGYVEIKVIGEDTALKVFKEVVQQIREQLPDEKYLDSMMERILTGEKEDIHDDVSKIKVNKPRKKKSGSKNLLRGLVKSGSRRKR